MQDTRLKFHQILGFTNYKYSELKDGAFNVHPQSLIYQPLTAKNEILRTANRAYIAA